MGTDISRDDPFVTFVALTLRNINRRPYGNPMGSDLTKGQRGC